MPNVLNLEKIGNGRKKSYQLLLYIEVFSGKNVLQEWLEVLSVTRDRLLSPECWSSGFWAGKASCWARNLSTTNKETSSNEYW